MIGKTLGHYQITSQIGKGGMGEVFQAKDQVLGRDVAIKVLPEEFARDADRVARFQREAKLLASLNHANIAAIYGLEESGGTNFLVLELVDGQTLADRIKQGPIPVEDSLKLALQIAEALEAAHEKGVIHRDLKPANIKVTPDGKVKVLDFGLAKAYAGEQAELNLSNSPTLSDAVTQQGVILGTAAYMSPEQAKGKSIDKRGDIWAFGVVLFEMLTGRQLFKGDTVSETLAAVLMREPDFSTLSPNLHPRIRLLLERCLEKEPKSRYHDIADARVDIQRTLADPRGIFIPSADAAEQPTKTRLILPWIAGTAVLAGIIAVAVWILKPATAPEARQVMRFYYELPKDQQFSNFMAPILALSPDGRQLVYTAQGQLYLRQVDQMDARPIPGTQGAIFPLFSPDGKWIGFVSDQKLKKISVSEGAPMELCDVPFFMGASWNADNTIIYSLRPKGILRISANGGTPEVLVKGESLALPQLLPDGKRILFTLFEPPSRIMLQTIGTGERKELFTGDSAVYLPTGHILYASGNSLFAAPFDAEKIELKGGSVPVLDGVARPVISAQFAISRSGTLVYLPGKARGDAERMLVWVNREGGEERLEAPPNMYRFPSISPDGTRLALTVETGADRDICILNLASKTLTRLTFDGKNKASPVWAPDGKRIAFFSASQGGSLGGIYWKAADGTGNAEKIASIPDRAFFPYCWSPDGKMLIGSETADMKHFVLGRLSMKGEHVGQPVVKDRFYSLSQPKISPDGRWMAYTSGELNANRVYVSSFPDESKGRWQISANAGDSPLWSPDGREVFYRSGDEIVSVPVKTGPVFSIVGTPKVLFRGMYVSVYSNDGTPWDISPDGKRFLMMKESGTASAEGGTRRINIVLNWTEELKQRVPTK